MMSAIAGTLDAVANGNASAIERWSADKAQAVSATAAVVEKGDPRGLTRLMGQTNDFPITSVGWSDKTFFHGHARRLRSDLAPLARARWNRARP